MTISAKKTCLLVPLMLVLFVCTLLVLPNVAHAADTTIDISDPVSGDLAAGDGAGGTIWQYSGKTLRIYQTGLTLTGTMDSSNALIVWIDSPNITLTLDNANFSAPRDASGLYMGGKNCTLVLVNSNSVTGHGVGAGVCVPETASLTINGSGSLSAQCENNSSTPGSNYGAGIGGARNSSCGAITITGGTITASSGYGAGIGGGGNTTPANIAGGNNICISGGTVTASSERGAGIGGGILGDSYNNTITASANNLADAWHGQDSTSAAQFLSGSSIVTNISADTSPYIHVSFTFIPPIDPPVDPPDDPSPLDPSQNTVLPQTGDRTSGAVIGLCAGAMLGIFVLRKARG